MGRQPERGMLDPASDSSSDDDWDDGEGPSGGGVESGSSYSDESSSSEEDEEQTLLEEMSHVPFDVLRKLKSNGGESRRPPLGAGPSARAAQSGRTKRPPASEETNEGSEHKKKRGKHMPLEVSTRRPYNPNRASSGADGKRSVRDPRFRRTDDKSENEHAMRNYGFVFNEVIPEERRDIKSALKKAKADKSKSRLQAKLKRLDSRASKFKAEKKTMQRKRELKSSVVKKTAKGKRPYYLKKSEIKKQLLLDKFKTLKKSGKLDDFLAKRRRRNAAKDHIHVPYERRG